MEGDFFRIESPRRKKTELNENELYKRIMKEVMEPQNETERALEQAYEIEAKKLKEEMKNRPLKTESSPHQKTELNENELYKRIMKEVMEPQNEAERALEQAYEIEAKKLKEEMKNRPLKTESSPHQKTELNESELYKLIIKGDSKLYEKTPESLDDLVNNGLRELEENSNPSEKIPESLDDLVNNGLRELKENSVTEQMPETKETFNPEELPKEILKNLSPESRKWLEEQIEKFQKIILESNEHYEIIKYGYGIWVPLESIYHGYLGNLLHNKDWIKTLYIQNPELGPFLDKLRNQLNFSVKSFSKLLGIKSENVKIYYQIVKNKKGVNLYKIINLTQDNIIRENFSSQKLDAVRNKIENFLISKETIILKNNIHLNWNPENLEQYKVKDKMYVILPIYKYDTKQEREKFRKIFKEISEISPEDIIKFDQVVALGGKGLIDHERQVYRRNFKVFSKGPGAQPTQNHFFRTAKKIENIELKKPEIFSLPKELSHSLQDLLESFPIFYKIGVLVPLETMEVGGLAQSLRKIGTFKNFSLYNKEIGLFIQRLQRELRISRRKLCELMGVRPSAFSGICNGTEGVKIQGLVSLTLQNIIRRKLTLIQLNALEKKIETFLTDKNTIITKRGFKDQLNWNPENLEKIKIGNREYTILPTTIYETKQFRSDLIGFLRENEENGKVPPESVIYKQFGGFLQFLSKKGIKYNDYLRSLNLKVNSEKRFDWNEHKNWETVKNWTQEFYYVTSFFGAIIGQLGRYPRYKETVFKFGYGFLTHLKKDGLPENEEIHTYRKLLKFWGIPVDNTELLQELGNEFDIIGRDCLEILSRDAVKGYRVYHPFLKNFEKDYVVPDGIVHNFNNLTLKKIKKSIYLEEGQKLDKFLDFKINFHCMTEKDWIQYPKLTKELHIYLLQGRCEPYEIDGCEIIFHSCKDLISALRDKISLIGEEKINSLIKRIKLLIYGRITDEKQKKIENFIKGLK